MPFSRLLPDPEIKPKFHEPPILAGGFFTTAAPGVVYKLLNL